ncbi:MAG: flagellar biosynthetic protein FliR [Myxococcota bacterium]|nr:flagellar biosynthetic protein FliR [Myxococcota bacterium]
MDNAAMIEEVFARLGFQTSVSVLIMTGALVAARVIPTIAFSPWMGGESVPTEVKVGLGLMLTIVLFPAVSERISEVPTGPLPFLLTLLKEVFIGVSLAFIISMVFDAARVAGHMVDVMTGAQQAQMQVPMLGQQGSIWSGFQLMLTVTLFLTMNGHHWVINILGDSLVLLPVDQFPRFSHGIWGFFELIMRVFGDLMRLGIALAAPGLLAAFLVDLSMGMVNKVAPQVQVFFMAMSLKPIVGALVMFVTLYEILSRIGGEFTFMLKLMQDAVRLLV